MTQTRVLLLQEGVPIQNGIILTGETETYCLICMGELKESKRLSLLRRFRICTKIRYDFFSVIPIQLILLFHDELRVFKDDTQTTYREVCERYVYDRLYVFVLFKKKFFHNGCVTLITQSELSYNTLGQLCITGWKKKITEEM